MSRVARTLVAGAVSGIVGGVLFGLAMAQLGILPTIAGLVRAEDPVTGFVVHMVVAMTIGAMFGLLVLHQRPGAGETLFWGASYATFWWFLGALTLLPLLVRGELDWTLAAAQAGFPSLLGHVLYGIGTAVAFLFLQRLDPAAAGAPAITAGALLRGAAAGLLGGWLLVRLFVAQPQTLSELVAPAGTVPTWAVIAILGVLAGVTFAALYPEASSSSGVSLVRGTVYGFLWWLVVVMTAIPLLEGGRIAWDLPAAREAFPVLIGLLLSTCIIAFAYRALGNLGRALFSADVRSRSTDLSLGARGVRAVQWGTQGGLLGGVLFGVVLARLGLFPRVAQLVGGDTALVGVLVHLTLAVLFGILYAFLFSGESFDLTSALGWGMSYGFFWWILGSLTLFPLLLGQDVTWTAPAVAGTFGALVGHLVYGASVGIVAYALEAQNSPWWIPHEAFKEERVQQLTEQLRTASPAIWVEVVILAVTLPLLLAG